MNIPLIVQQKKHKRTTASGQGRQDNEWKKVELQPTMKQWWTGVFKQRIGISKVTRFWKIPLLLSEFQMGSNQIERPGDLGQICGLLGSHQRVSLPRVWDTGTTRGDLHDGYLVLCTSIDVYLWAIQPLLGSFGSFFEQFSDGTSNRGVTGLPFVVNLLPVHLRKDLANFQVRSLFDQGV